MEIAELIIKKSVKSGAKTPEDLARIKREFAKKYKKSCLSNIELLKAYHKLSKNRSVQKSEFTENLLKTRPVRSLSGIVNVSVLTKPYPCPGKCIYCPTQKGAPKSYLKNEPAVMRAVLTKYDPEKQARTRILALKLNGHPTDKIELRIIGGTWSFYPKKYQNWFIKKCFDACNGKRSKNLKQAQKINEKAKRRIIGLSIETRPDYITIAEIKRLRNFGVTMVELGIQSIYDDVLKLNKRGHGVKEIIEATKLLKNAGFKVLYQMMPNLPGSTIKRDGKMFEELFQNPDFQPDYLKIYQTAVLKEAQLYKWWKQGRYKPYSQRKLIKLMKTIKEKIPYYVRIQRITRDIPSQSVMAGPAKISNLRQILAELSKKEDWQCKCIRCREVKENYNPKEKIYLFRQDYDASGGKEIFLSYENKNRQKLFSLLRLRINQKGGHFISELQGVAVIRELHTYGQLQTLTRRNRVSILSPQHKGLGKKLVREAEKITKDEFCLNAIAVISGVGARRYYRKLGYNLENSYMIKEI